MMRKGLSIFLAILAIAAGLVECKTCEEKEKCNKCLKDKKCAWRVKGSKQGCEPANTCYPGWGEGTCYTGADFPSFKKACKRMEKGKTPLRCKKYHGEGNCYGCMKNGCFWLNEKQKCLKSCDEAPEGTTCQGTYAPTDGRNLLSFADEAGALCYGLNNDYYDKKTCASEDGDCSACLETTLQPRWPDFGDDPLFIPKTCEYLPDAGKCVPNGGDNTCPATDDDDCGQQWPQLQNRNVELAKSYLESLDGEYNIILCNEAPEVFIPLPPDFEKKPVLPVEQFPVVEDPEIWISEKPPRALAVNVECYTEDFRCDRIRLFFDGSTIQIGGPIVTNIPQIG